MWRNFARFVGQFEIQNPVILDSLKFSVPLGPRLLWWHSSVLAISPRAMDILREFLESSTIHGLTCISTAKVSNNSFLCTTCVLILDNIRKMLLVHHCYSWFCRSWISYQQFLLGVVKESCFNWDINPPHCWPGFPHSDSLPSEGLTQCSQLWPHEGQQQLTDRHEQEGFKGNNL